MPTDATWNAKSRAIEHLQIQIKSAMHWHLPMKEMSNDEKIVFSKQHPGAHFVIGDFEIKCLKPEKYNL